jgi:hydroxyacylglutathione hydrolase
MILKAISVGPMQVNCYILAAASNTSAIIIDPGYEVRKIKRALDKNKLTPAFIINTHGHIDHIGCDDEFGVPVYIHKADLAALRDPQINLSSFLAAPYSYQAEVKTLEDKDSIELGTIQLEVIHTPGHTAGGICLLMKKPVDNILFSGDTLFYQSVGRSDFPGADGDLLVKSIKERLLSLPDDTVVYPGHGPSSTIGNEKANNPFIN